MSDKTRPCEIYSIIVNKNARWAAPEWLVRNLVAHLDTSLALAKTDVEERLAPLFEGRDTTVDLTEASAAEMRELLKAAESARRCVKQPEEWAEPESGERFIEEFAAFLDLLHADERVKKLHV